MVKWFEMMNSDSSFNKTKIFLFPYAGGGASVFRSWKDHINNVDLLAAQYPGRENRMNENPIDKFSTLLNNLYSELLREISDQKPYYLFGHSLGTKLVFELVILIQKNKLTLPKGIIVSAGKAPCFEEKNPIHKLDDENFIKEINRFSGTPSELINNVDVMKIFLPMLRADFKLDETYINTNIFKIDIPILGLMGTEDKELTIEELLKWGQYTSNAFSYRYIEGGHMFINTNTESVVKEIKKFIDKNDKNI